MAYQPESNCNAANYNPNDILAVDPRDYYAQAEQKAAYQGQNADAFWKKQLSGIGQTELSGAIGLSSPGKPIPTKSLQDEADRVRSQSDQLKNLLGQLQYVLFEPVPAKAGASLEKDNPSTIEGNLQHAARTLSSAILSLENILAKIGGR